MVFFSVIIPLYNKKDYIKRCLESVLNQSYENLEIIIINDGSTDKGEFVAEKFKSDNVTIVSQLNQGVSVARNTGVSLSRHDHVVFLDADDTWDKDFLLELTKLITKFPDAGIYGINHRYHYANGRVLSEEYNSLFNGNSSGIFVDYFKTFAELGKSPFSNSGCCYPKSVFEKVGGYKPSVKTTEDSDLWCRIALTFDVAFEVKSLATYYLETPNNTRNIIEFKDFQVSTTLQELIKSNNIPEKYILSVKRLIAFQQVSLVKRALLTGNRIFALKKIFDKRLLINYPITTVKLFFIILLPYSFLLFLRNLTYKSV